MSKKRRRASMNPRNRYSENPPDFGLLASLYPSFTPFVFSSRSGRPTINWKDFNATRELTRALLHHDHGVNWWIPDGQLCPTVPNRSNYIHWIEDLLSSELIPARLESGGGVRGFDIGTGANCIYPLLGASLLGWNFVGSDVTDIALEWARKNVESNSHLLELIEIRNSNATSHLENAPACLEKRNEEHVKLTAVANSVESLCPNPEHHKPPVLVGVVRGGEYFDFCMCNPPFFNSIQEAGLNPKTSCGGTFEEMVCPGGEHAFISRIIEDSFVLKHSFRWFTSMVGRKTNLKFLVSKLRELGVSIVKTTEFVQGQTARWGLAWSFVTPRKNFVALNTPKTNNYSFTLEGLQRQFGAVQLLKSVESFFIANGASCTSDISSFCLDIILSGEQTDAIHKDNHDDFGVASLPIPNSSNTFKGPFGKQSCRVSVFEQIPGTLLVRGILLHKESPFSGVFSSFFQQLEEALKKEFVGHSHRSLKT